MSENDEAREALSLPISLGYAQELTDGWKPLAYARQLATSLASKYPDKHPDWEPLPDLMGLLTQIDNATTGLVHPSAIPAPQGDVREAAQAAWDLAEEYKHLGMHEQALGARTAYHRIRTLPAPEVTPVEALQAAKRAGVDALFTLPQGSPEWAGGEKVMDAMLLALASLPAQPIEHLHDLYKTGDEDQRFLSLLAETIDYMQINNLEDPDRKHNVRLARAVPEVTDERVERAVWVYTRSRTGGPKDWMRAALTAALGTGGEHGE